MKRSHLLIAFFLFCTFAIWGQTPFTPEQTAKLENSTFELLIQDFAPASKQTTQTKYTQIGTAYLADDGTFWSSSSLINPYFIFAGRKIVIRDSNKKIYEIDSILALSSSRDIFNFTVSNFSIPENAGLSVSEKESTDSPLFLIYKNQEKGFTIQNITLADKTPESKNNPSDFLFFTLPEPTINAGSPVINSNGEVCGILTHAIKNQDYYAAIKSKFTKLSDDENKTYTYSNTYVLPIIQNLQEPFEQTIKIDFPKSFNDFHNELALEFQKLTKNTVIKIHSKYDPDKPSGFTLSSFFTEANFYSFASDFPYTIICDDKDKWDWGTGKSKTIKLQNEGSIEYASIRGYDMITYTKPDDISLESLLQNPQKNVAPVIQQIGLKMRYQNSTFDIPTLGDLYKSDEYTDYFGRTWYINYYKPYENIVVLTFTLPLPSGLYIMTKIKDPFEISYSYALDMEFLADHTYTSFFGSLNQWKEYTKLIQNGTIKAADFQKEIKFEEIEDGFKVSAGNYSVNITSDLFIKLDDVKIVIPNAYVKKNNTTKIENRGISVYTNNKDDDYRSFSLRKQVKPLDTKKYQIKKIWTAISESQKPFNNQAFQYQNFAFLNRVISISTSNNPDYVYSLGFETKFTDDNYETITTFADNLIKNLILK